MSFEFNRRDFLKLLAVLPTLSLPMRFLTGISGNRDYHSGDSEAPNVIILVFDAWSATNISLYGYHRPTTPNLERLAQNAIVYHNHYAAGSFTTPGTASLFTGLYPWTHRAFHIYGTVDVGHERHNLFDSFTGNAYATEAYSHNDLALSLLYQFEDGLSHIKKTEELSLFYDNIFSDNLFVRDHNAAFLGERVVTRGQRGLTNQLPSGLFTAMLHKIWRTDVKNDATYAYKDLFPRGLPSTNASPILYLLEDAIDWVIRQAASSHSKFFGYYHFFPPHEPYNTRRDFVNIFDDGWIPTSKPEHYFTEGYADGYLSRQRREYDEYIAYVDAEFGRFMDQMEQKGLLDNTIVVLTSDHGEMFERGILEHVSPTLFDPLVRIPLMIFMPGQQERVDVKIPTSCVDVLPTLLEATGHQVPSWGEGLVLPPFSKTERGEERSIFTMDAKGNYKNSQLSKATIAMIKGRYKIVHYFGYDGFEDEYELFDLENDPEELENIYMTSSKSEVLRDELLEKTREVNQPYRRDS